MFSTCRIFFAAQREYPGAKLTDAELFARFGVPAGPP